MENHDAVNFEIINKLFEIDQTSTLVDVGANMGLYTDLFLSKVNDEGKVFSIELDLDNYLILKNNHRKNNNLILLNCAISNKAMLNVPYYKHKSYHQMTTLSVNEAEKDQYKLAGTIETSTLDEILKDVKNIDILKLDIEGGEFYAIDGMKKTLKKTDVIFYENHSIDAWKKVSRILYKYSFKIYDIERKQRIKNFKKASPYQCLCIKNRYFKNFKKLKYKTNNHWIFNK